ncbi:MAG TPA: tRNA (adenosine(37)-N6)-threonylcarbamoyltransferase complex transferase subunit TsaD, partial [Anaerolineae bacterium]|nr:tRNA (adenosine(37)-N6)-threonylcarbamoyltransferase complex transferase subunit TsaD [Anaerolineae bacterium]
MTNQEIPTRILAIETSCDETAAAVVENGRIILSNVIASQVDIHAQFGGVFPEVASRKHIEVIYPVVAQALEEAHLGLEDLDCIAVTQGPGLAGSLLVGVNMAKGLALARNKPFLGINHIEGHVYSPWLMPDVEEIEFPVLALVVSGGHT